MNRALLFVGWFLAMSSFARSAESNEPDPAGAEVLFQQGVRLWKEDDRWQEACELFEASFALERAAATQSKLAACLERRGQTASAWVTAVEARKLIASAPTEERRAELEAWIGEQCRRLEPRVPQLAVRVEPVVPGLRVLRGATEMPVITLGREMPVDPGEIVVAAGAPGYAPDRVVVTLAEGEHRVANLRLLPVTSEASSPPGQKVASHDSPSPPRSRAEASVWPFAGAVAVGAGAASLLVAAGFGLRTLVKVDESDGYCDAADRCSSRGIALRDDARAAQTVAFVLGSAGVVVGGAGALVLVTRPASVDQATTSARYVGLSWTGAAF